MSLDEYLIRLNIPPTTQSIFWKHTQKVLTFGSRWVSRHAALSGLRFYGVVHPRRLIRPVPYTLAFGSKGEVRSTFSLGEDYCHEVFSICIQTCGLCAFVPSLAVLLAAAEDTLT